MGQDTTMRRSWKGAEQVQDCTASVGGAHAAARTIAPGCSSDVDPSENVTGFLPVICKDREKQNVPNERPWREAAEKAVTAARPASVRDHPGFGFQGSKEINRGDCRGWRRHRRAPRGTRARQRGSLRADASQQLVSVATSAEPRTRISQYVRCDICCPSRGSRD